MKIIWITLIILGFSSPLQAATENVSSLYSQMIRGDLDEGDFIAAVTASIKSEQNRAKPDFKKLGIYYGYWTEAAIKTKDAAIIEEAEKNVFEAFQNPRWDQIPIANTMKLFNSYYVKIRAQEAFFKFYRQIDKYYAEWKLKSLPEVFSNDIEMVGFTLHFLNREEYIGIHMSRLIEPAFIYEAKPWKSEALNIELIAERAAAYNMRGEYQKAHKSLEPLKLSEDPSKDKKVFARCYAYIEKIDLAVKQKSVDDALKDIDLYIAATRRAQSAYEKNCLAHGHFIKALLLVTEGRIEEAQKNDEQVLAVGAELSLVFSHFTQTMIASRNKSTKAYKFLKEADGQLFALWTRNDMYVAREKIVASIYLKDRKIFNEAVAEFKKLYQLRWENTRLKDLNDAWEKLGQRIIFGKQIKDSDIEADLKKVEQLLGPGYLGLRRVRHFIKDQKH